LRKYLCIEPQTFIFPNLKKYGFHLQIINTGALLGLPISQLPYYAHMWHFPLLPSWHPIGIEAKNMGHMLGSFFRFLVRLLPVLRLLIEKRFLVRQIVLDSVRDYEIIEAYHGDKYLTSYLVFSKYRDKVFYVLFAVDVEEDNIRVITAYYPSTDEWEEGLKTRRK
jgi:hypothetical protein